MMVVAAKNGTSKKSQAGKKPYPPKPDPKDAATTVDAKRNENIGNIGSKIHAQRKFAQGAPITPGTFSTVKLSKEARKKRKEKRPTSPVFLPLKRPKTEDFLAFLCFRGTGVLSPDLDYFNYTPSSENVTEDGSKVSTPENEKKSGGLAKFTNSLPVKEDEPRASTSCTTLTKKEKIASGSKSTNASNCDSASSTAKSPALKKIPDVMVVVKQAEKAIAAFGKGRKDSSPTITKPPRLNEQDAKFAMTALKLKYQEKRLAKSKPAITVASKITKKGKTVILTRSKSKNSGREISKSPPLKKVIPTKLKKDARSQSRNAPSPDIIFGVSHGKQTKKPELASEESESDGSGREASSGSNDDEENSTASSDDSDAVPVKRSLRNGKELMTLPEKLSSAKSTPKRKSSTLIRVSTRASHRQSTSPLRELPMYNIKKKKNKPAKGRKSRSKKTEPTKETEQELAGSSRPTRKTKETASIYLGLINRFTSDEDDSSEKQEDGNESTGSSSSSEAKFLEKHYNASIKRDEQSNTSKKSPSSKTSTLNASKINSKKSSQPKNKPTKSVVGSSNSKDAPKKGPAKRILRSQSRDKTPSPPLRRIGTRRLSMPTMPVDNRTEGAARKSATVYPRRRDSYFSSSSGSPTSSEHESSSSSENENEAQKPSSSSKNLSIETGKATLAARKSATIIPRKSSVSHTASSTKNANKNSVKATKKIQKGALVKSKATKIGTNSSEDEDEDTENDSDDSKKEDTKKIIIEIQRESPSQVSGLQDSSSDDESSENDAQNEPVSSAEEETKPVIETTSIAIQVDLDSEEASNNSDSQSRATSTDPPEPPLVPTPPVTSAVPITVTASGITNYMSSVNISNSQIPYHFSSPNPAFYPTLHLTPPVVNNIQLLTRGTQEFSLNSPAIAMNIPVRVPFNGIGSPILQPNTMCFSSTSISAAATLQTHIRSVAANLDIPLVRPIVGAENPLNIPFPRLSMSHMMRNPNRIPLTRPVAVWSNDPKPHSSAFRVPNTGVRLVKPGSSNSSNAFLPLSVMQQQHIHNQHMQYVQSQSSSRFSMMSTDATSPMCQQDVGISASNVSNTNTVRTGTPVTTPGYSIIHSLPNVSIVPRFDRNSKPVVHPNDQEALERKIKKSNIEAKNKANAAAKAKEQAKEAKEKGGKKKKILLLPQQTSPLTVRKDSTAPATYAGVTAKKGQKTTAEKDEGSKEDRQKHTAPDPFNKLLQLKKPDTSSSGDHGVALTTVDKHHDRPIHYSKPKDSGKVDKPQKEYNEERNKNDAEEGDGACTSSDISEVPTFFPTEDQFQDPVKYIEEIRSKAEAFGMAKIVPPRSFRPDCNVDDDMRFTAYNHYIHKMYQRWGPNVHETQAIKEHLRKSDIDISTVPMIGGMEIDLCTLYHTVQLFGGLKETIEKQKWNKVSDAMHIPKAANDRASKLDSVYMKYVLPYEMLSDGERKRLLNKVEKNWNARQQRLRKKIEAADSSDESDYEDPLEEVDDCIIKGKSTPLSSYFRVARNTRTMIFQNKEPSTDEVEEEYWSTVRKRTKHLCVYSGSIDCTGTTGVGWGFPLPKASNNKHPWNLKVLATNPGSILRSMGPVMGATVPTLHVGMIFTTYCWYRDPHGLPWVEYLHSGGEKIWYVIPAAEENKFRNVVKQLMPLQCRNKKIWLASDSAMIPPELLVQHGVSLSRVIQNPGEFVVVFPKSYTSAICTSYVVSESVCFAPNEWLLSAPEIFSDIKASKEPPVFPIEKLLLSILQDHKISFEILKIVLPQSEVMLKDEFTLRKKLVHLGVQSGKLGVKPSSDKKSSKKRKQEDEVQQCDTCNYILYLSLVTNETHGFSYCLPHALEHLQTHKAHVKTSVLRYDRSQEDLIAILKEITNRLSPS